jgi:hypothetical protein
MLDPKFDPGNKNTDNYKTGVKVEATMWNETRQGFVAKQLDDRHFLIKLEYPFNKTNRGKPWLKVCRDYAEQVVKEI